MKKVFQAQLDKLDDVLSFTDEELEKLDCPMKSKLSVDVALEEVFVNVANYAYRGMDGFAEVEVDGSSEPGCVRIRLSDSGKQFNPLAREDPDVTKPAEERNIGGLGIFMTKKMMDNVEYEYKDGKNILTLTKYL